jgi:hypothetical protein
MTPREFINSIGPAAQVSQSRTNIPASFTIAQAALESGWGESQLTKLAFNLFGIKADSSWPGEFVEMPTQEFEDGKFVTVNARFRKYANWQGSIDDHAVFLLRNPRYKPAFDHTDNADEFARAIAAAGYATDPAYATKLSDLIRTHNLSVYDTGATVAVPEQAPSEPAQPPPHHGGEGELPFPSWPYTPSEANMPTDQKIPQRTLTGVIQDIASVIPEVGKLLLDNTLGVPARNLEAATVLINKIVGATQPANVPAQAWNAQSAVTAIVNDPLVASRARAAVLDDLDRLTGIAIRGQEADESSRDKAAARAKTESWDSMPYLMSHTEQMMIAALALESLALVAAFYFKISDTYTGLIVGAFISTLTMIGSEWRRSREYRLGSSQGSKNSGDAVRAIAEGKK